MTTDITSPPADPPVDPAPPTTVLPLWTRGDTNAFFGLGFNILVNVLTLTGLMIGVVSLRTSSVFTCVETRPNPRLGAPPARASGPGTLTAAAGDASGVVL